METANRWQTTFLDLPAELRNHVYELSLPGCLSTYDLIDRCRWLRYNHYIRRESIDLLWLNRSSELRSIIHPLHPSWLGGSDANLHAYSVPRAVHHSLLQTNKQIHGETIAMWYGMQQFLWTLLDKGTSDQDSLMAWLDMIGPSNASLIHDLRLVYRREKQARSITRLLVPELRSRGIRTDDGVVRIVKLLFPCCACENCVIPTVAKSVGDLV